MDNEPKPEDRSPEEQARLNALAEEWGRRALARLEREWPAMERAIRARQQRWN